MAKNEKEESLMNDVMEEAHLELLGEESAKRNDPTEIATIHAFTDPREYRTMGRMTQAQVNQLAIIATKGVYTRSRIRGELVRNLFFMSRSEAGWGSIQAAEVAKSRSGAAPMNPRGFMARTFGRRETSL